MCVSNLWGPALTLLLQSRGSNPAAHGPHLPIYNMFFCLPSRICRILDKIQIQRCFKKKKNYMATLDLYTPYNMFSLTIIKTFQFASIPTTSSPSFLLCLLTSS